MQTEFWRGSAPGGSGGRGGSALGAAPRACQGAGSLAQQRVPRLRKGPENSCRKKRRDLSGLSFLFGGKKKPRKPSIFRLVGAVGVGVCLRTEPADARQRKGMRNSAVGRRRRGDLFSSVAV